MPTTPHNSKCAMLGCKSPRSKLNSFCLDHGGKDYITKQSDSVYRSPAWRSIRQGQLSRHPLCQSCLSRGRVEQAQHVDHVFPWRQIGSHAFLRNVFQSLCAECHSYKTGQERQGRIEQYGADGVTVWSVADYAHVVEK